MTIAQWLYTEIPKLDNAEIETSRLDALILLEFVIGKDRPYILAHGEEKLTTDQIETLTDLINIRIGREPIAYILGKKEFYGRDFFVNYDVLIPRPESENFLELLKTYNPKKDERLVDIGTGSGALAISAKLEFPQLRVAGCDISDEALGVAKENAKILAAKVRFYEDSLLNKAKDQFNYIFANLPYVPLGYSVSPEVHKEPEIAVYADSQGLDLVTKLAPQAFKSLKKGGLVFIESLPEQQDDITEIYTKAGLKFDKKAGLVMVFVKH